MFFPETHEYHQYLQHECFSTLRTLNSSTHLTLLLVTSTLSPFSFCYFNKEKKGKKGEGRAKRRARVMSRWYLDTFRSYTNVIRVQSQLCRNTFIYAMNIHRIMKGRYLMYKNFSRKWKNTISTSRDPILMPEDQRLLLRDKYTKTP